ncbi:MAG: hypothetical protein U0586_14610 [Candidatus Brocadiaceae bacterium]
MRVWILQKRHTAGVVMVAESAGLIGAALRRSPVSQVSEATPLEYPEIQDWFSFSAEKAYAQDLALIVGIAARTENSLLTPFMRQLGKRNNAYGTLSRRGIFLSPAKEGENRSEGNCIHTI